MVVCSIYGGPISEDFSRILMLEPGLDLRKFMSGDPKASLDCRSGAIQLYARTGSNSFRSTAFRFIFAKTHTKLTSL
jgi:hypothetical protein